MPVKVVRKANSKTNNKNQATSIFVPIEQDRGVVPNHWRIVLSSEILDIRDGTHDTPKYVSENGVPLITSKNLKKNRIDFDKVSFISFEDHYEISKRSRVEVGDILFAMIGTIGNPVIINGNKDFSIKNVGLFKKNESIILPSYMVNFLRSSLFEKQLSDRKLLRGTTQKFIPLGNLRRINIPLPPLLEQHAIVSKIDELFSELDKGKQQLETSLQQLKVYRQAVLKWAFEGKLTNKDVKEGELPEGWKRVKNRDILKYVTSGSRDWKQYYSDKGSRFVRTQDINSNKLEMDNVAYVDLPEKVEGKRSLIEEGDILMIITGANVGKVAVVNFPIENSYVSQSVALLKYHDKRITYFLWYYFQAQGFGKSFIDKLVYGVGRPVLSLENMREVEVLLPPIEEQQLIIHEIESRLSVCDNVEETINQSLTRAETLRQSILKMAFEGKLV